MVLWNDGQVGSTMETLSTFGAWTSTQGTPTVSVNQHHHGVNSWRCQAVGDGAYKDLGAGYSDLFVRVYAYFVSLPNTTYLQILTMWDNAYADNAIMGVNIDGAGAASWLLSGPSGDSLFAATINTGQWYSMELERKVGAGNGVCKLWVDGLAIGTKGTETINNNGEILFSGLGGAGVDTYFDCIVANDSYNGPEEAAPALGTVLTCLAK